MMRSTSRPDFRLWGLLLAALIAGLWGLSYFIGPSGPSEVIPAAPGLQESPPLPESNGGTAAAVPRPAPQVSRFESVFRQEVAASGRVDTDPEASERRLNRWAAEMQGPELRRLAAIARNPSADGDERALAAEVLARASQDAAIEPLQQLATTPVPVLGEPRRESFERALRARALEGLGQHPDPEAESVLMQVAGTSDDTFLADRARRALAARRGQAPLPQEQDRRALEKLAR